MDHQLNHQLALVDPSLYPRIVLSELHEYPCGTKVPRYVPYQGALGDIKTGRIVFAVKKEETGVPLHFDPLEEAREIAAIVNGD